MSMPPRLAWATNFSWRDIQFAGLLRVAGIQAAPRAEPPGEGDEFVCAGSRSTQAVAVSMSKRRNLIFMNFYVLRIE
jgi:hypothetical protein